MASKKLLIVVNVDWFFLSHRLSLAKAAKESGFDVSIACADTGEMEKIREYGFQCIEIPFSRKGTNFVNELSNLRKLYSLYKRLQPDLVHHVTIKPVIYGSIAARPFKSLAIVNAITGLGYMFSAKEKSSFFGWFVRYLYKISAGHPGQITVFQNPDDQAVFLDLGISNKKKSTVIRGSGVNVDQFRPPDVRPKEKMVLLASRMIRDKGVEEFTKAAKIFKKINSEVQFILAGKLDPGNPNAISKEQLQAWTTDANIKWIGYIDNMPALLHRVSVVVLPTSYPEGVPKILIEAASCEIPLIATDVPGCREIVRDGINGYLFPPGDIDALVDRINLLFETPEQAEMLGKKGREIVIDEFSEKIVIGQTLKLYRNLLDNTLQK